MTPETIVGLASFAAIVTAFVQFVKKTAVARNWDPVVILVLLSLLGGVFYALLIGFDLWDIVLKHVLIVATGAEWLYKLFATASKLLTGENRFAKDA